MRRPWLSALCASVIVSASWAADDDYRSVDKAITAKIQPSWTANTSGPAAHLGIHLQSDPMGKLVIDDVQADSPAEKAGVKHGDVLTRIDGKEVASVDAFKSVLHAKSPGNTIKLSLSRGSNTIDVSATLVALSRPMASGRAPQATSLGVQVVAAKEGDGVTIEQVVPGSVADKFKLKTGETILKIDDAALNSPDKLREILATKKPDDSMTLTLLLAEKKVKMEVKLDPEPKGRPGGPMGGGWNRGPQYWTKPTYRLAIILVEFKDVKHNKDITPEMWEKSMFSKDQTYKKTATGQDAYGSMYDYYFEQSYGQLKIEGKAFNYVQVSKDRIEYEPGGALLPTAKAGTPEAKEREKKIVTDKSVFLTEALDKLIEREGKDALKDFDGVYYIYAGGSVPRAPRGGLYWPHRSSIRYKDKNWPYFICQEGGARMNNISVFCHEFGHMLGLPDLYARPENPGSEGLGGWCAMSNEGRGGRPQHFSAWCKDKLGWIKPTVIDPTVKQKLVLAPIETSSKDCLKVLVRPDGSEYFLLENRGNKGFDATLPGHGLLVWRVVGNRPILEESHGVLGPRGPYVFGELVPFPSESNRSFTPFTTPSSRSQLGGGLPVWITNIEKLSDGRIGFQIGYEYE
ncbi:MAG TPA: M6 family metalloprotease domain-containing protein [Gemmataceae bacterium]|jgi:M6 family metalloprotease-like protein|nr:M6 family metalloprotease domain-containing protein [Gemmataceae bacterium]